MVTLCSFDGFPMLSLWFPYVLLMVSLCLPYAFSYGKPLPPNNLHFMLKGATAGGERRVEMSSGMSSGTTRLECRVGVAGKTASFLGRPCDF